MTPLAWAAVGAVAASAVWFGVAVVAGVVFGRTVKHADEQAGITQDMQDRDEVQR